MEGNSLRSPCPLAPETLEDGPPLEGERSLILNRRTGVRRGSSVSESSQCFFHSPFSISNFSLYRAATRREGFFRLSVVFPSLTLGSVATIGGPTIFKSALEDSESEMSLIRFDLGRFLLGDVRDFSGDNSA